MPIATLAELFLESARLGKPDCLLHKSAGRYRPISSDELAQRVRSLSAALADLGLAPGDRVALMADNGPHWPTVDFAVLCSGAVLVPVYPTLPPDQAAYIVADSGAKILVVETREMLAGFVELAAEIPDVEQRIIVNEPPAGRDDVLRLDTLIEGAPAVDVDAFEQRARSCRPDDLATLIYTSGTTGKPKGVMLTHGNITSNVLAGLEALEIQPGFTTLSFLPLSHSFERTVDYMYFHRGCTIAYAESVQTVAENLLEVEPHLFVSVPRVYEKVLAKVQENVARSSALKRWIFAWALGVGRRCLPDRLARRRPGGLAGLRLALADRLVFSKIRARLGGRFRFAISGGAPLARELAEFFWSAGIEIYEGYGLTESSPVISVNRPGAVKLGTVGRPIPGVEVTIAPDKEILARGPNIMQGYFNLPEETTQALDGAGWLHTGDVGEIDGDGFLAITDRKKELIVSAYGKNVAPAPIENALKASRFIAQAVVLGDRRKFLSALLVPDFEALAGWARQHGVSATDPEALAENEAVRELVGREVDAVNRELAHFEQIHAWRLLPVEFSVESGELTPTQKVKRRVVTDRYAELIDQMYREAEVSYERAEEGEEDLARAESGAGGDQRAAQSTTPPAEPDRDDRDSAG